MECTTHFAFEYYANPYYYFHPVRFRNTGADQTASVGVKREEDKFLVCS